MHYLLLILLISALAYGGWRMLRAHQARPKTRGIGPDDDPEFLWRLSRGDNKPQ